MAGSVDPTRERWMPGASRQGRPCIEHRDDGTPGESPRRHRAEGRAQIPQADSRAKARPVRG